MDESLIYNSRFYCPCCTGGGDLYVKNTLEYSVGEKPIYFCKKCNRTFKIEVLTNG